MGAILVITQLKKMGCSEEILSWQDFFECFLSSSFHHQIAIDPLFIKVRKFSNTLISNAFI